ncbi:MAG: hypothetical protein IPG17_30710 [Sandaracinaceae bacterium]|nr:hypothetical protein [Sandaracinaceae bacterium]
MDEVGTDGVFEIEVYDGVLLLDTHGDVRFNADGGTKDLLICAKRPVKCLPPSEQIPGGLFDVGETPNLYGFVRHIDGTGIDGLTVRLARFTFDSVSDINTAAVGDPPVYIWDLTSLGGWFKFTGSLSLPADLLVNVYDGTGTTPWTPGRSCYQLNSGPNRFEIYLCNESLRGPSEFLRISIELSKALYPSASPHPHYTGGLETKLLDCTMEQLIWLSARTHWPLKHIADRARAEDLHNTLEIMGVSFSAEDLYGLLREGCPKNLRALLALPPSSILAAHGRAKRANVINGMMGDEDITDALKAAIAISLNEEAKDSLGEILRTTAAIDEEYITAICAEVAGFTGTDAQLWTNIAAIEVEEEPIPTEQVDEAKRLIQIATIGLGSAPVVAGIITELDDAPASTLGTWSMATWGSVATAVDDADLPLGLAGGDLTERRNSLARLLNENAALAFPPPRFVAGWPAPRSRQL